MDIIFIFTLAISLFFILIVSLTKYQKNKATKILNSFSNENLNKIEIGISETSYSNFSQNGGTTSKALLYYNQDLLILTPTKKSLFSGLLNTLPLILILKIDEKLPKEFEYKIIENIVIKREEYILSFKENTLTTKKRKEISLYSTNESENIKLKQIITKLKEIQTTKVPKII